VDRWEYCEVDNSYGATRVRPLTTSADGWTVTEVAQPQAHNMAIVLARLGEEGWEVLSTQAAPLAVRGHGRGSYSYTSAECCTSAFLKRRIAAQPADQVGDSRPSA